MLAAGWHYYDVQVGEKLHYTILPPELYKPENLARKLHTLTLKLPGEGQLART